MVKNPPVCRRRRFDPWVGRGDPLEKSMATHSSVLPWRIHGQRSLVGCGPWGRERAAATTMMMK